MREIKVGDKAVVCNPIWRDSTPPDVTDWPTPKDVEECGGVWEYPSGGTFKTLMHDLIRWRSREDFNMDMRGYTRVEPIPAQCIQGYDPRGGYDPYGLTDEQRDRWEKVTEWD